MVRIRDVGHEGESVDNIMIRTWLWEDGAEQVRGWRLDRRRRMVGQWAEGISNSFEDNECVGGWRFGRSS